MTLEEHQAHLTDVLAEAAERLESVLTLERQVHDLEDQARELQEEAYKRLHRGERADEPEQQEGEVSS